MKTKSAAAGQLARRIADKLKFRQDVFLAELALGPVYCMYYGVKNARRYEPLPRFPAVERDFSLLLAEGTPFAEVVKAIRSLNIPEITSVRAADLFRGKNVPAGKYLADDSSDLAKPRSDPHRSPNRRLLIENHRRAGTLRRRASPRELGAGNIRSNREVSNIEESDTPTTYRAATKASHVPTEGQPLTRVLTCLFLATAIFGMGCAPKAAFGVGN